MSEIISMPHSNEAEEALLGSTIIDPEAASGLSIIQDDFYLHHNGIIWDAICRLRRERQPVDYVTLANELERTSKLEHVGGRPYLMQLVSHCGTAMNIEGYAAIVQENAKRRKLIRIASEIATGAYNQDASIEALVSKAASEMVGVANLGRGAKHISKFADMVLETYQAAKENPCDVWGIPTGLTDFDYITGGMQLDTNLILSGEPGLGKTILGMQLCHGMAEIGKAPGAVYSMEMSGESIARRSMSAFARVATRKIRTGKLNDDEFDALSKAWNKLINLDIYMDDSPYWTTTTMKADLARLKDRAGIQWVMIDYLDLLRDEYGKDDTERTKHISGELHAMMRDLHLSGLTIHTMNKAGVNASDKGKGTLAGSVKVIYDADDIWIITRPDVDSQNIRMERKKGREGDILTNNVDLVKLEGGYPMFGMASRPGLIVPDIWSANAQRPGGR
jgi:replicative DNA helicase